MGTCLIEDPVEDPPLADEVTEVSSPTPAADHNNTNALPLDRSPAQQQTPNTKSGTSPTSGSKRKFVPEAENLTERFSWILKNIALKRKSPSPQPSSASRMKIPGRGCASSETQLEVRIKGKIDGNAPCKVCGKWFANMPPGAPGFCWVHKRVTDCMRKRWAPPPKKCKQLPAPSVLKDNEPKLAVYKDYLKKSSALPPSPFSKLVLTYMAECPPDDLTGIRPEFQLMTYHGRQEAFSKMMVGWKRVRMHKSKYDNWLEKDEPYLTPEERKERWEELCVRQKGTTDRTEDGPAQEPTRCMVLVEDYESGEIGMEHSKSLDLQSKPKAIKDQNHIEESRAQLSHGHISFEHDMFGNLGGGSGAADRVGRKRMLGHNFEARSEPATIIGADAAIANPE